MLHNGYAPFAYSFLAKEDGNEKSQNHKVFIIIYVVINDSKICFI